MKLVIEMDDLWSEQQIHDQLLPLKWRFPSLILNVFAIPNKLGPVHELKKMYPWINFCIHGFEHTHFECGEWTADKAQALIGKALEMGYEPIFKAPNHYLDDETAEACKALEVTLVHNNSYKPTIEGLKTFRSGSGAHGLFCFHLVKYPGSEDYLEDCKEAWDEVAPQDEFLMIQDTFGGEDE